MENDTPNANIIEENIAKLAALFPQCVTERKREDGTVEKAIDLEKLAEEIKPYTIEENLQQQRYEFTWPEKRLYSRLANAASPCALRPCREESRGRDGAAGAFDSANVYIEGDNLEALKILRETYFGKVKMIYIDPPYNTGSDFIYRDRFVQDEEEYLEHSGQLDEEGARLFPNTESNGRFHTDWLNMIYPRLKVARNLLSDDGVIFISIDDNEAANLKKICDELFGEGNFVCTFVRKNKAGSGHDSSHIAIEFDYALCYAKNIACIALHQEAVNVSGDEKYKYADENVERRGKYYLRDLDYRGSYSEGLDYPIETPDKTIIYAGGEFGRPNTWRWSKQKFEWGKKNGFIVFQKRDGKWKVYIKQYQFVDNNDEQYVRTIPYRALIDFSNGLGSMECTELLGSNVFSYPKPSALIKQFLKIATDPDSLVLDFFSGSATTAHAVMQLNADDGGNRRFILVQLPEACAEDSEAFKAGFSNICEIGKERIRRAGDQILRRAIEELEKEGVIETCALDAEIDAAAGIVSPPALGALRRFGYTIRAELLADAQSPNAASKLSALSSKLSLDTGFRVFKVDSSNMLDVCVTPAEFTADSIYEENIKKDRTPDDLLIQAMLEAGIELSSFIEERKIEGKRVFFVGGDALAACFDEALTNEAILQIAKAHPRRFCMRDSGYTCDCDADNFEQIFKAYSPHTARRVM